MGGLCALCDDELYCGLYRVRTKRMADTASGHEGTWVYRGENTHYMDAGYHTIWVSSDGQIWNNVPTHGVK